MLASYSLGAQQLAGKDIVDKSNNVPSGNTMQYIANLTLTDKNGKIREREISYYEKKIDNG